MFSIWRKPKGYGEWLTESVDTQEEAEAKIAEYVNLDMVVRVWQGVEISFKPIEIVKSVKLSLVDELM